jgi:hypothetical protein
VSVKVAAGAVACMAEDVAIVGDALRVVGCAETDELPVAASPVAVCDVEAE